MNHILEKEVKIAENINLLVRKGLLANKCDSSIELRFQDNVLLITFVYNKQDELDAEFLPLNVEYREKFYSAGRIPYNCKSESKLNDHEILVSRLIDRCIRPCFSEDYRKESQIIVSVLSHDNKYDPKYLACFGTSLCLMNSCHGFYYGPVSEVFLYLIGDKWVINPQKDLIADSSANLVVGGTEKYMLMCEGSANGIDKYKLLEGINLGLEEIKNQCKLQLEILNISHNDTLDCNNHKTNQEILSKDYINEFYNNLKSKLNSKSTNEKLSENTGTIDSEGISKNLLKKYRKESLNIFLFNDRARIDGRRFDDIREIDCKVDYLPSVHGSALFTRGNTQALVTVTLGDKKDEQPVDEAYASGYNKLILNYNFPGFCVGEISYSKSISRREIGHGNLALSALKYIIPDDNLFTIRIVSDILSSDGSSSMATVCGSCMALKDAGININKTIAGIAMGLFYNKHKGEYIILSDISADEDELGDMDLKVIGTSDKIYGIQLDVKFVGLNSDILTNAISQALEGLLKIIEKMNSAILSHRPTPKSFAPHCTSIDIEKPQINYMINNNWGNVLNIQKKHNCCITINKKTLNIIGKSKKSTEDCVSDIMLLIKLPSKDETYEGIVKKVQPNFALVEFMSGSKTGILKKEDVDWCKIDDLTKILFIGNIITVKVIEIQDNNKFVLSHKILIKNWTEQNKSILDNI